MEGSRHNQNIQINKVIGENEKCIFFNGKNIWTFWPAQNMLVLSTSFKQLKAESVLYIEQICIKASVVPGIVLGTGNTLGNCAQTKSVSLWSTLSSPSSSAAHSTWNIVGGQ